MLPDALAKNLLSFGRSHKLLLKAVEVMCQSADVSLH